MHRKLHPTYENWLPLARAALYAQGESLHVTVWPGGLHNTFDLPALIARDSRSYVIACSGLMRAQDFPADTLDLDLILSDGADIIANGGSTILAPDGTFLIEPVPKEEALIVVEIDAFVVHGERQNLDRAGNYSRPDVLSPKVDRKRRGQVEFRD